MVHKFSYDRIVRKEHFEWAEWGWDVVFERLIFSTLRIGITSISLCHFFRRNVTAEQFNTILCST